MLNNVNKASIASKSNGNIVVQGSTINNTVLYSNEAEIIKLLGKLNNYDIIQSRVDDILTAAEKAHPLYPDFKAVYNNQLHRLISTPETEEALKKYPKQIKGKFQIDLKKYPYMNKAETPWEYAYRTQMPVELLTTEYKEYLGDIEDPFPVTHYSNGMITVIKAPEFPPEIEARLIAGEQHLSIRIRRIPCMEYGKIMFSTVDNESGLNVTLTVIEEKKEIKIRLSKISDCELAIQLRREQFINSIKSSKHLIVKVGPYELVNVELSKEELNSDMFLSAPYMINYIECLLFIEKSLNCKFKNSIHNFTDTEYFTALIMASSLKGKWHCIALNFDDEVRCDYDQIPDEFLSTKIFRSDMAIEGVGCNIYLQGLCFSAEQYLIVYKDAQLNNINSVIRNRKKRKKHILLTFRPISGKDSFSKYCRFNGIKLV